MVTGMVTESPPAPPAPDIETEAGVIEDARARQRHHRLIGTLVLAAAAAIAALLLGFGSGGGGGAGGP